MEICFGIAGKCCWKRRKCWLPAFSPFPTVFSKFFFFRIIKNRDCVVKSKVNIEGDQSISHAVKHLVPLMAFWTVVLIYEKKSLIWMKYECFYTIS